MKDITFDAWGKMDPSGKIGGTLGSRGFGRLIAGLLLLILPLILFTACHSMETSGAAPAPATPAKPPSGMTFPKKEKMNPPPYQEIDIRPNGTPARIKSDNLAAALASDPAFRAAQSQGNHREMLFVFLERYREFFKLPDPRGILTIQGVQPDTLGNTHVRVQQVLDQIPVWGKTLLAHFKKDGALYLFQGDYIPGPTLQSVPTSARLTASEASAKALAASADGVGQASAQESKLYIWVAEDGAPRLAYGVTVSRSIVDRSLYFVDAQDGRILHKAPLTRQK